VFHIIEIDQPDDSLAKKDPVREVYVSSKLNVKNFDSKH